MTALPPQTRPAFRPGVRFQRDKLAGKALLLFPEGMQELNETGTSIVELVDGTRTVDVITETLGYMLFVV